MRLTSPIIAAGLAILSALAPQSAAAQQKSLYARVGGYDALAAVTDDFIGRLATDPTLGKFFKGHGTSSGMRIRQLIVDQLCAATGGPCIYIGRDMKTTHQGLGITEADWETGVGHLKATFAKFKVPMPEQNELLTALGAMKGEIVEMKR
jgi:hemoglobin